MKPIKVAVIIPAFNEGPLIAKVVRQAKKVFATSSYQTEIVVVNDGSRDQTAARARKAGAHVISHVLNVGSGAATATGLAWARRHGFTVAVTIDGDGQHDPSDALRGVDILLDRKPDLLIGSRSIKKEHMSPLKVIGNKGLSLITFLLFGINVSDSQSGLRVFSERALRELHWDANGYEFCSEMLWRAKQIGYTIEEFPIKTLYSDYSRSKGQNNWNGFNIVKLLVRRRLTEILSE
jgi:glycosyltransferase involved in cell wall biosynthesis